MSLDQLRQLDQFRFFIRSLDGDETNPIKLASMPFFVKPIGTTFVLSMLRDVDFSIKYTVGKQVRFEIYAIRYEDGESQRDSLRRLYKVLKRENGDLGDDVFVVYNWSHIFTETEMKTLSRKRLMVASDFNISWWMNYFSNVKFWMMANPEVTVSTSLLVSKICAPIVEESSSLIG